MLHSSEYQGGVVTNQWPPNTQNMITNIYMLRVQRVLGRYSNKRPVAPEHSVSYNADIGHRFDFVGNINIQLILLCCNEIDLIVPSDWLENTWKECVPMSESLMSLILSVSLNKRRTNRNNHLFKRINCLDYSMIHVLFQRSMRLTN